MRVWWDGWGEITTQMGGFVKFRSKIHVYMSPALIKSINLANLNAIFTAFRGFLC